MHTQLTFDSATDIVVATITGAVVSAQFRNFALQEIALLKEKKAQKMLINITGLGVMSLEDQSWLQQEWNTKALQAGLRYLAFVVPKDIFGIIAMKSANADRKLIGRITISYFDDIEKAKEWIGKI